ncbi:hypothetical protein SCUCBS95973_001438 [Sporothrix curviconia]|uniref:Protein kinase domain-containing protein n=1 Tax=Sporothrix curviconia TaxID=1260050 RepID=A0ABP0AYP5_9PEZI
MPSTPPPREDRLAADGGESSSKDELIARLLQTIAEKDKTIAEQGKSIAEMDKEIAEMDKEIADRRRDVSKTGFLDYLRLVQERVYDKFTVETDRSRLAQGTTSVAGKFCPRRLRFWEHFGSLHDQKFQELHDSLHPLDAGFASPHDVAGLLMAFSPKSKNEATLRPFLRVALEKPAAAVVNAHLDAVSADPEAEIRAHVHFSDVDRTTQTTQTTQTPTTQTTQSSKSKQNKAVSTIPDRVCMYNANQEKKTSVRFLVGEYKAAHRLAAPALAAMLESPPEDYLVKAAGIDKTVAPGDAPNDAVFSKKYPTVYLAKALCQTYHYMISGALEYGYIATGHGLILLHVLPGDLDTLYYYSVTFTLDVPRQVPLAPRQTAAAYMATLVLLSLRDTAPSDEEIGVWAQGRMVWPRVKYREKRGSLADVAGPDDDSGDDDDDDDDAGSDAGERKRGRGGGGEEGSGNARDSALKRGRMGSGSGLVLSRKKHGGARTADGIDSANTAAAQGRPLALDLPYCTQACLRGVVHQLPLDEKCPNVALHRAASLRQHGPPDRHPLTEAGIRDALLVQAKAAETDATQRCVPCGRQGRYGALVRVAVTCAGYALVAKATYVDCVDDLQHELRIYKALKAHQGRLVPVCLGVMTFLSARFTADCMMRSLLFLSYAGQDLGKPELLPLNVNLQAAMDRTAQELHDLGLRNDDIRVYNCAWNPETRRVLHFDFDRATMADWEEGEEGEEAAGKDEHDLATKEDPSVQEQQQHEPKTSRSPLLKRGLNTLRERTMDCTVQKEMSEGRKRQRTHV